MADVRAIAVCKGGPLDGQHFSVLLDEQGSPPPLESRAEVAGALYMPGDQVDLSIETVARFHELERGDGVTDEQYAEVVADFDAGYGHVEAYEYTAHAFTVKRDKKGLPVAFLVGAAL